MQKDFYATYFDVEKTHWLMRGRRAIVLDMLSRFAPAGGAVLDFGCGSGLTVDTVARAGYRASGVDFSKEAIDFGAAKGIRGLQTVSEEKLPYADNSFDAVLCMDVLEHLADETTALSEMRRVLKPGGALIIMVPAYMFLWGKQDEVAHHFRRYTMSSLQTLLRRNGDYRILKRSYFNTVLFPAVAMIRFTSRFFGIGVSRESDFDLNSPLINIACGSIFAAERAGLRFLSYPFGVSILLAVRNQKKV